MRLILASASPRRSELLQAAGIPFETRPAGVDESVQAGESADAYVRRLAVLKARAVSGLSAGRPVLAADTIVLAAGEMLGKPRDTQDAARMLRLLSGTAHEVLTGVCLAVPRIRVEPDGASVLGEQSSTSLRRRPGAASIPPSAARLERRIRDAAALPQEEARIDVRVAVTTVEFARLSEAEIAWYVGTGETMDKAGAYAVQGLASRFVTRLHGSYSNVVGLPVALVYEMCNDAGILLS